MWTSAEFWHRIVYRYEKSTQIAVRVPIFIKNSSCDFGLPSAVTSDTYYRDTHNDYCKKPSPRHIVIFFYSVVKKEVSLCVPNNCICREFFYTNFRLDTVTSTKESVVLMSDRHTKISLSSWQAR